LWIASNPHGDCQYFVPVQCSKKGAQCLQKK